MQESLRVLKSGGYFLLVLLSKETEQYLTWNPKKDLNGDFENEGVLYHFFTLDELIKLFGDNATLEHQKIDYIKDKENLAYIVTLFRKK